MDHAQILSQLLGLIDDVLSLNGRAQSFTRDTALLGALPELDSMAVVDLIAALEQSFEFEIALDDIDGDTFATVGTLQDFIAARYSAALPSP